ncbi:hypothetical protein JW926_14040 [Candidatus Sumerlaeota bacterium]|nr:hypothetical protein [Candidatus Sumerlaeota bacterium]
MILGVSHIAMTVPDPDPVVECLRRFGFHKDFVEKNIPNPPEKKPFVHSYSETHTLAFMKGNLNSIGLEIIQYPALQKKSNGKIKPAFDVYMQITENPSPDSTDGGHSPNDPVMKTFILVPSTDKAGIFQISFSSDNFEKSRDFWRGILGFHITGDSPDEMTLQPSFPMPNWQIILKIKRAEKGLLQPRKLDVPGANLVSLITTNIVSDREKILYHGEISLTRIFPFRVNNKNLKLCLGYSPEGQVLEFLEAESEARN